MKIFIYVISGVVIIIGLIVLGWYGKQQIANNNISSKTSVNNAEFTLGDQTNDVIDYSNPYSECSGNPVEGTCQIDGACFDNELEQRVYSLWKNDLILREKISEQIFNDFVEISDVSLDQNDDYISIRIQAIYINDWMRSRNAESIRLKADLLDNITDEQIQQAINFNHPDSAALWEVLYYQPIISIDQVKAIVDQGYAEYSVRPDFCSISSKNSGLLLTVFSTIDSSKNDCIEGVIDLLSGDISYKDTPCSIE